MNDKEYVSYIWHFKVEDNLGWEFCSGYMKITNIQVHKFIKLPGSSLFDHFV